MGAELIGFPRSTDSNMIVIGTPLHSIVRISLFKLDQGKVCNRRREFEAFLNTRVKCTKNITLI